MKKITAENFITDDKTNKVFISSLIDTISGDLDEKVRGEVKSRIVDFAGKENCESLYNTKDVWTRDYMPIQLTNNTFLGYTYKPDYLGKDLISEKCVTNWTLHNVHAEKHSFKGFKVIQMPLILDGGNVVKAILNEKPCIIMCDKVLKENNIDRKNVTEVESFRNWWKDWWKENFDGTEMNLILLPWEGSELNPIGHADGMIRYISWNRVLLTNYEDYDKRHFNKMKDELETAGFNVVHLHYSDLPQFKENKVFSLLFDRSWCYINFLQLGTRILIPKLGYDPLDNEALKQIKAAFETTEHEFDIDLIKVDMTSIVENMTENKNSGGALNCLTWTIKA